MSSKTPVSICARWLGTALGPATIRNSTSSRTSEPVDELRSRLLLLDSLKPEDLTATLADGRLLRLLRRRLLRSRHASSLFSEGGDLEVQDEGDSGGEGNDNNDEGEEANRRRVSQFLDSCRTEFHLPDEYLFEPSDLLPEPGAESNPDRVLRCLQALSQSDTVAAAGLASDAVLPVSVDDVAVGVANHDYSILGDYATVRWDAPVLDVLDQLIGFFRACCTLARQLRESPLSLWPGVDVDAVFGRSADLLELLTGVRISLRNNEEQLDEALAKREAQLMRLYGRLWWHMTLTGNRKLKELKEKKGCLEQVTLALGKLPQAVESAAKCAMDLQQMPKNHLRRLKAAAEKAMEPVGKESDARQRLQAAADLLKRVDERVYLYLLNANKHLEPSFAEFETLAWPRQLQFRPTDPVLLCRLRHSGSLLGPEGKRLHACLWDGALVLSQSGDVHYTVQITSNTRFEELAGGAGGGVVGKALSLSRRPYNFVIGSSKEDALTLGCDTSADRQEWLNALNRAKSVWCPAGFDKHGHRFCRTAAAPDIRPPPDTCRHCGKPLGCWAHRCQRCKIWLHRRCVTAGCYESQQQYIRCQPMAPPRHKSCSLSSLPPTPKEPQSWSEPVPIDAETAKVKIRQLPETQLGRRRNFLLCPTSEPSVTAGYKLYVLSGESMFTYQVEPVSEARMLRIAGEGDSFPDLQGLVRHYELNPLPPPPGSTAQDGDEDDIYELDESEGLKLDSGVANCY